MIDAFIMNTRGGSAEHEAPKQELLGLLEKSGFRGCVTEHLVSEEGRGVRGLIGDAVPPLFAKRLAEAVRRLMVT